MNTGDTYECACPSYSGLVIGIDGYTCVTPTQFLIYSSIDEGNVHVIFFWRLPLITIKIHVSSRSISALKAFFRRCKLNNNINDDKMLSGGIGKVFWTRIIFNQVLDNTLLPLIILYYLYLLNKAFKSAIDHDDQKTG